MTLRRKAALALTLALTLAPQTAPADGLAGPYLAAMQATFRDDYNTAARYFTEALAQDPDNPFLIQNAILNNVIAGQFDTALPLAKRQATLASDQQLASLVLIADAVSREDYATAQAVLGKDGVRLNPLLSGLLKGWVAAGAGDTAAAQDHFESVSENDNFKPISDYHRALVLALAGNFDGAAEIFDGGEDGPLRISRASVIAHAQVLVQLDRRDDAVAVIEDTPGAGFDVELIALRDRILGDGDLQFDYVTSPIDGASEVFLTLATALGQEEADRFALLYARLAQHIRPGYVEALLVSADILDSQRQYDMAVADFAKVPRDSDAFRSAAIGQANALAADDQPDAAVDVLTGLAAEYPEDFQVHEALGDVLRREERYDEAAEVYTRAIDLLGEPDPVDWRSFYVRGISYERTDRWDQAEADFRRALELRPEQPLVLNYLGYSLVELGLKIDEAKDMIERAVAGDPDNGFITDSLGWVLYRLGRFEDAVPHMERAVELLPNDPVINDHLGDVLWMVGRKTEAVFQWRRALSFEPEDKDATRIRLKLELGLDAVLAQEEAAAAAQ